MLLASGATSLGYDGHGDFAMGTDGRLTRRRRAADGAVRVHRRIDRASAPVRRRAARAPSRSTSCGTRRSTRDACSACASTACGCTSARRKRWRKRKGGSRVRTSLEPAFGRTDAKASDSARVFTVPPGAAVPEGDRDRDTERRSARAGRAPAAAPSSFPTYTLLLPTRRATRALQEAFLDAGGGRAMLLPTIRPIAAGRRGPDAACRG